MSLPANIVSKFEQVTRYPLATYLNQYTEFIDQDRSNILNYYAGNVSKPNQNSFDKLKMLLNKANVVNHMIEIHRDRLTNVAYWELIEVLTNVQVSLWTIDNSSKWLRSAISKNNFTPEAELQYTLKQIQTLEDVAVTIGSNDQQNDWVTIALRNDLIEEQYTPDGGNNLIVGYRNKLTVRLNSVVDNITGEKAYGIDIDRKITFEDEDLKPLSYKQTIKQAVDILANLTQGDTPEFPQDGIQSSVVVGSNRASIAYPILFRQFYATFRKDDTLKSLIVTKIDNTVDALQIQFSVETRLGEEIQQITQL